MRAPFDTVAVIASRQHGRVTRDQLLAAGVDRNRIGRWIADGRLRRVHVGVCAVGHRAPSVHADYMAAVLACGDGAAESHFACSYLLQLLPGGAPPPEVTVPTTADRGRPGIIVHRVRALPERDVSTLHGIPITTAPRTLLDLAPYLTESKLARACHEAWHHHRTTPVQVEACIARNPHKRAIAKLRRALGADITLSGLEDRFLELVREHDLPLPRTNISRLGDSVDCHWPDRDVVIELVTFRFHATRHAFEQDVARRRRSNHLAFTYGDVFDRGRQTVAELRAALDHRA